MTIGGVRADVGEVQPARFFLLLNLEGTSGALHIPCECLHVSRVACFFLEKKSLCAPAPPAPQVGVLTCVPAVGRHASQPVIIIH